MSLTLILTLTLTPKTQSTAVQPCPKTVPVMHPRSQPFLDQDLDSAEQACDSAVDPDGAAMVRGGAYYTEEDDLGGRGSGTSGERPDALEEEVAMQQRWLWLGLLGLGLGLGLGLFG